jgi:hypothetical protein
MSRVIVKRKIHFPLFGLTKWKDSDYESPLRIALQGADALFLPQKDIYSDRDLVVVLSGYIELIYNPAPRTLVSALASNGKNAVTAAEQIYSSYLEALDKIEALLLSVGRVRNLSPAMRVGMHDFFQGGSILGMGQTSYRIDEGKFVPFLPKLPRTRGINPLFKADQLITPRKWKSLQESAYLADYPENEVLELYRIRSRISQRDAKIPTIEAAILSESLLRQYGEKILDSAGFSKSKIKRVADELTFNNLLNVILPLSLTKTELQRMRPTIESVDALRRVRNSLVHGDIQPEDIHVETVVKGVNGALRLGAFLKKKMS